MCSAIICNFLFAFFRVSKQVWFWDRRLEILLAPSNHDQPFLDDDGVENLSFLLLRLRWTWRQLHLSAGCASENHHEKVKLSE